MMFSTVLRRVHDYTNQFNTKWKKNQFGGRKVVWQATCLPNVCKTWVGACTLGCAANACLFQSYLRWDRVPRKRTCG